MLEHVVDDARFAAELARITRPGGSPVVNTPHLAARCGGAARPGPDGREARAPAARLHRRGPGALLAPGFDLEAHHTYSRFFSELVDTVINAGLGALGKRSSAKGMVVTGDDVSRHRKLFRAYGAIYPAVWLVARLDALVPASGYMLIAAARRRG